MTWYRFGEWIIRRRFLVLIVIGAMTAFFGYFAAKTELVTSFGDLLPLVTDSPGHIGLSSMRERAEMVNGSLKIDSGGRGTVVTVRLPLDGVGEGGAEALAEAVRGPMRHLDGECAGRVGGRAPAAGGGPELRRVARRAQPRPGRVHACSHTGRLPRNRPCDPRSENRERSPVACCDLANPTMA